MNKKSMNYINKKIKILNDENASKLIIDYFRNQKKPIYPNQLLMMGRTYDRYRRPDDKTYMIEGEYFPQEMCEIED